MLASNFENKNLVYSVLVPLHIKNSNCQFDYLSEEEIKIGTAVEISLGNSKKIWGIVKLKKNFSPTINYKKILVINKDIIFNQKLLKFIDWVSEWTMSSPGSTLKLLLSDKSILSSEPLEIAWSLPSDIKNSKNISKIKQIRNVKRFSTSQKEILEFLLTNYLKTENEIKQNCNVSNFIIKNLEKKNLISKIIVKRKNFDDVTKKE